MSPELPPRTGSSASVRSRGSSVSLRRTLSQDESQTMKRSMSRESTTPRKPKHFVVKSKASRVAHRTTSSTSLARTPSNGKGVHQATLLSMTNAKPKETIISTPTSAGNQGRQKALSMTQTDAPSRDLMRKILSDESGKLFYLIVIWWLAIQLGRSTSSTSSGDRSTSTLSSRPRRSSNLSREAVLEPTPRRPKFYVDHTKESDSEEETIQIQHRGSAPLLEERAFPYRRISDRSPPTPPVLQLRGPPVYPPKNTQSTTAMQQQQPQPTTARSGLTSAIANTPPQPGHLIQPGPGPVAPPYLTTTPAVITELSPQEGSSGSLIDRLNRIQQGELNLDEAPLQTEPTSESQEIMSSDFTSSPEERRGISLENTRYALSPEAHMMIRKLSNGPIGSLRQTSPSPPPVPSGWNRPERSTRAMQKQVMYRDLEQQAMEQHHGLFSPPRPDSRTDYFHNVNPPTTDPLTPAPEDDAFLNTYGKLMTAELRRINRELNNVKVFSDPMHEALERLAHRSKQNSPIIQASTPMFSLGSSFIKRFSPERRDSPPGNPGPSSLPSRLRESPPKTAQPPRSEEEHSANVFQGESESKLKEVTRQLWFSWPERPVQETDENTENENGEEEGEQSALDSTTTRSTSVSPVERRDSSSRSSPTLEKRGFGSGLRQTWGSALALAGIRH